MQNPFQHHGEQKQTAAMRIFFFFTCGGIYFKQTNKQTQRYKHLSHHIDE